jgi:hypothetical protein
LEQGLEIQGEHNFICLVGGVGVAKRGLSTTTALSREIIPFPSYNLRCEAAKKRRPEILGNGTG